MTETLAQTLGFEPDDRIAVVHCDDIGMCHASNLGAFEALDRGPATSGSLMVPCPWFREAADLAAERSDADLGVHLTLNAEWSHYRWGPVAGRRAVPSLCDDQGYLPRTVLETVQRARPEEVEIELRAQIDHALESGIDVTHLDSHMGACFFPPFVGIYGRLAEEYRLPCMAIRPDPARLEAMGLAAAAPLLGELVSQLDRAGVPILDGLCADSLRHDPAESEAHNRRRLEALGVGVTYLICHPALDGEELRAVTPESAVQRDFERRFYGGESGRRVLDELGIRTVGMRALRDRMRRAGS